MRTSFYRRLVEALLADVSNQGGVDPGIAKELIPVGIRGIAVAVPVGVVVYFGHGHSAPAEDASVERIVRTAPQPW